MLTFTRLTPHFCGSSYDYSDVFVRAFLPTARKVIVALKIFEEVPICLAHVNSCIED